MRKFAGVPDAVSRALSAFAALRFDQAQTLTQAQAAQARVNLGLTAPLKMAANTVLSATLGLWREYEFAGAYTATAPAGSSVFSGWRTGCFHNRGNGSIITANFVGTIGVQSGDYLDGVLNGTKLLAYGQKGYLYFDATATPNATWRWVWVDRNPTLMIVNAPAGTASFDFSVPAGYQYLDFCFSNIVPTSNAVDFGYRASGDGGNTFRNAGSDYYYSSVYEAAQSAGAATTAFAYQTLIASLSNSAAYTAARAAFTRGTIDLQYGSVVGTNTGVNSTPAQITSAFSGYPNASGTPLVTPNRLRFLIQAGTFSCNGHIRGVPAQ